MPFVRRTIPLLAVLAMLLAAAPAMADVTELGDFADQPFPTASCPDNCQAIGKVSGYQVQIGTHKNPYVVPKSGRIVAFTIKLGNPNAQQVQYFNGLFGGAPSARISVLKTLPRGRQAELLAQSEVFQLSSYLGSTPSFVLSKPLSVQAGRTIALTVPTWVPAFGVGLGSDFAWRSSRSSKNCNSQAPSTQEKLKSVTAYQCFYRTARLLYSVTYVVNPTPTNSSTSHH
jgi:hypothetical protein